MAHSGPTRTVLVGLELGTRAVRYRRVTFQGGIPELKQAVLDRFMDVGGVEDLEPGQLIIHVKRQEFGEEFEEIELDSDIADKSVLKIVVDKVCVLACGSVKQCENLYSNLVGTPSEYSSGQQSWQ